MKFVNNVYKKYKILSSGIKDVMLSVKEYFENEHNQDDYDYLVEKAHSKDMFLNDPVVHQIAKRIHNNLDIKWLYDIVVKK